MFRKKGSFDLSEVIDAKSQDPIWTIEKNAASSENLVRQGGIGYWLAAFFLVAQMAGAGFLSLPKSFANAGWGGVAMITVFCCLIAFSGTRLGKCWVILEERWPEYRKPCRQPYMDIAERSFGKFGRGIIFASVILTLIGATIVFLILMAQFINAIIPAGTVTMCTLIIIVGGCLVPFTWPGTPKDFWQASVLAVVATFIACTVIVVQLVLDRDSLPEPKFENPTIESFSLGFGSILFAFGGASVFPTYQNDMKDRSQFKKSVILAFSALLVMYLPVAIVGYLLLGSAVPGNILIYAGENLSLAVKIAVGFEITNLFATYIIAFNPICQTVEDLIGISRDFSWKRCVIRSLIVGIEIVIALQVPDFGLILNLVGGSTVTICSFLFPPMMYMRLVSTSPNTEDKKSIPFLEKMVLYLLVIIGLLGGITTTYYAVYGIITTPFGSSCYAQFAQFNSTATE